MRKHTPRHLKKPVLFSLKNHPVVFVSGPRQAGKSTLVQKLAQKEFPAEYISLDNLSHLSAANQAPSELLSSPKNLVIDEVQMSPGLFRPLKEKVDQNRFSGSKKNPKFLLTGSVQLMSLPRLSQALVGRMIVKTLYPFSLHEVLKGKNNFIKRLFQKKFQDIQKTDRDLSQAAGLATFPRVSGTPAKECSEWFDSYLLTLLQRDVRILSQIQKTNLLPRLLQVLALRAGSLINEAAISRDTGLNAVTCKEYRHILEAVFLTFTVPPWYRNVRKRLVKSPKGYFTDTLLLCHLRGLNLNHLKKNQPVVYGHIAENFVATELLKQNAFGDINARVFHFRTSAGKKVDFILEKPDGKTVALEVKTTDHVSMQDFNHIKVFEELVGKHNLVCGVVLYGGKEVIPFGKKWFALPFEALGQ